MPPNVPAALAAIDVAHSEDPNKVSIDGKEVPYELHYAQKCTRYLDLHVQSDAPSPLLTIAIRAQHFRRWEVPRDTFPKTKPGYFAWRTHLKKRQGQQVKEICLLPEMGFSEDDADRVAALIAKEGLKDGEPEVQILEDVACLVFLDDQFEQFEQTVDEEKMINILRKTWGKMSPRGRDLALQMDLSSRAKALVSRALAV
jgi:hypothetical protein